MSEETSIRSRLRCEKDVGIIREFEITDECI
jgi:hypothetical protein